MSNFKVGDILTTQSAEIRGACLVGGGNPDRMEVRSLDFAGDPIFTWEHTNVACGYCTSDFTLADTSAFDLLAAMTGKPLKFRSGCEVKFVAYAPEAKPHCQLVLLNTATGNIVLRYANGKGSDEPYNEPGDILNAA